MPANRTPQGGAVVSTLPAPSSAINTLASRLGVEPGALFLSSLKSVAFKAPSVSNEQLMALIVTANQYRLNPFLRELYAFPDKSGGIVPIVSVDGWYRIINEHPQLDGVEYTEGADDRGKVYGEATIHRKDRRYPTVVREYLDEVRRATDPWRQHERRMLRHKAIIQCARLAFGFAGIYEPDEGERIIQATRSVSVSPTASGTQKVRQLLGVEAETDAVPLAPDLELAQTETDGGDVLAATELPA